MKKTITTLCIAAAAAASFAVNAAQPATEIVLIDSTSPPPAEELVALGMRVFTDDCLRAGGAITFPGGSTVGTVVTDFAECTVSGQSVRSQLWATDGQWLSVRFEFTDEATAHAARTGMVGALGNELSKYTASIEWDRKAVVVQIKVADLTMHQLTSRKS